VEWAKRKLLNPHSRVTEVAFDVGYQWLSQFNRSFLKYAGESPTKFREQSHTEQIWRKPPEEFRPIGRERLTIGAWPSLPSQPMFQGSR